MFGGFGIKSFPLWKNRGNLMGCCDQKPLKIFLKIFSYKERPKFKMDPAVNQELSWHIF